MVAWKPHPLKLCESEKRIVFSTISHAISYSFRARGFQIVEKIDYSFSGNNNSFHFLLHEVRNMNHAKYQPFKIEKNQIIVTYATMRTP